MAGAAFLYKPELLDHLHNEETSFVPDLDLQSFPENLYKVDKLLTEVPRIAIKKVLITWEDWHFLVSLDLLTSRYKHLTSIPVSRDALCNETTHL